ncbi:response regulator [Candidatus Sumerlaeota bacterium]|nr:response regulator [Candidatus Sumerlaeota bacterium]
MRSHRQGQTHVIGAFSVQEKRAIATEESRDKAGPPEVPSDARSDAGPEQETQSQLDALRRLYETILSSAAEGICGLDRSGRVTFANPAAAAILGRASSDLIGADFCSEFHRSIENDPAIQHTVCPVTQAFASSRPLRSIEDRFRRSDGTVFPVELSCSPIVEKAQCVGAVLTFSDIADRHRAEEEKRRVEAHMRHAQKLEAIGTLAGGIAHDFNNILLAVLGHCELAMLDLDESSSTHYSLREVVKAAGHAKQLAHQILTFSRQVERERIAVQVAPLVSDTVRLLRATLPASIEIRESISSSTTILADPTQIHQIVMNLGTNASHAMRENGGVLEISLRDAVPGPELLALHPGLRRSPYVSIEVRDTGHGMSPGIVERIFEPFFTTKELGEGTGLGLSTVHGIVKDLGGEIAVWSEEGKGALFTIYLPSHEQAARPVLPKSRQTLRGAGERVLFVDDEPAIVHLAGRMLVSLGYEATVCKRGREAFDAFRVDPTGFDLIVTDMIMPEISGERLIEMVREIRPEMPFLVVTGYNDVFTDEKAAQMGVKHYLLKPFASRDLGLAIRSALKNDAPKNGRAATDAVPANPVMELARTGSL